ncbi:MAG TPA: HD domain-containing protein [Streptosporangiaceae bacterium]
MKTFTSWHTWADAEPGLSQRLPAEVVARLARAVEFARLHHGDQRRKTGVPYLEHLLEALQVLVEGAGIASPDVLVAAVLHDVVEDTPVTLDEVSAEFGPRVAELVGWVTIPAPGPAETKSAVRQAYLRRLRDAPPDAALVKLADRASNVQTLRNLPLDQQRSYYEQTVSYIVPLAAGQPWFAAWYGDWQAELADLAEPRTAAKPG